MSTVASKEVMDAVSEAFRNARENGFEFIGDTFEEIADDMMGCDADIENMPRDQVVAAIESLSSNLNDCNGHERIYEDGSGYICRHCGADMDDEDCADMDDED